MNTQETTHAKSTPGNTGVLLKRTVFALAALITLTAVFYTIENLRGKRAWEACKKQYEAAGDSLDWSKFTPAPVPDDQNIFKAPKMQEWFVGRGQNDLAKRLGASTLEHAAPRKIAEISIVQASSTSAGDDVRSQLLHAIIGTSVSNSVGHFFASSKGTHTYFDHLPEADLPLRIELKCSGDQTAASLEKMLPGEMGMCLKIAAGSQPDSFTLIANSPCAAADYISWLNQCQPDLQIIRDALKRPAVRMDGDYTRPFEMPIPNFVCMRMLAQTLADGARCHFLLGQPDQALDDLELIDQSCRMLEAPPNGKPMTLVAAMINVAIKGLYVTAIQDGLEFHAWREPQLIALQTRLHDINIIQKVWDAFECEPAAVCTTLDHTPAPELAKLFSMGKGANDLWPVLRLRLIPRGWYYQNLACVASCRSGLRDCLNPSTLQVIPRKIDEKSRLFSKKLEHPTPYNFLAAMSLPNFSRAWQVAEHNEALIREAETACALERFHLAHGDYPDRLEALVPQFMASVPADPIGDKSLKFRRLSKDQFVLYSIGWDETDDDGKPTVDYGGRGDWVWGAK